MKQWFPYSPSHLSPWTTIGLGSVSMDLPILNVLHKWNHIIHDLWWLASCTWHNVFRVYQLCSTYQNFLHSFLWLQNILLYGHIRVCLSIHWTGVVSTCWLLWTVPLGTRRYMYSFRSLLLIILVKNLAMELLGHMVISFFRNHQTVFQKQNTSSVWGF